MKTFLGALEVPVNTVVMDTHSRTPHRHGIDVNPILEAHGWRRVLLVTSALHMWCALATFRAARIGAIPAPTDFEVRPRQVGLFSWFVSGIGAVGSG